MVACGSGHKDVVQLLLDNSERNIDMNARSNGGSTAFIYSCKYGRKDVVKLLVEHSETKGIDISTGQEVFSYEMRAFIDSLQYASHTFWKYFYFFYFYLFLISLFSIFKKIKIFST